MSRPGVRLSTPGDLPSGAGPLVPGRLGCAQVVGGLRRGSVDFLCFVDDAVLVAAGGLGVVLLDPESLSVQGELTALGRPLRIWPRQDGGLVALCRDGRRSALWRVELRSRTAVRLQADPGLIEDPSAVDVAGESLCVGTRNGGVAVHPFDGSRPWLLAAPDPRSCAVPRTGEAPRVVAAPEGSELVARVGDTTLLWRVEPGAEPEVARGLGVPERGIGERRFVELGLRRLHLWGPDGLSRRTLDLRDPDALYDAGLSEVRIRGLGWSADPKAMVLALQGGGVLVHGLPEGERWRTELGSVHCLPDRLGQRGSSVPRSARGPEADAVAASRNWVAAHDPATGHVTVWRRGGAPTPVVSGPVGSPLLRDISVGGGRVVVTLQRDPRPFAFEGAWLSPLDAGGDLCPVCLSVSEDGQRLALGTLPTTGAGEAQIVSAQTGTVLSRTVLHAAPVGVAVLAGSGCLVALGHEPGTGGANGVRSQVALLAPDLSRVGSRDRGTRGRGVVVSRDGSRVAVLWGDRETGWARWYDSGGRRLRGIGQTVGVSGLRAVCLGPKGELLVGLAVQEGTSRLVVWRTGFPRPVRSTLMEGEGRCLAVSPCGLIVGVGLASGLVQLFRLRNLESAARLDGHLGAVRSLHWDRGLLWSHGAAGRVLAWGEPDAAQGQAWRLPAHLPEPLSGEVLDYGPRSFRLELVAPLRLAARGADGTLLASMPRVRHADDPASVAQVRETWRRALQALSDAAVAARRILRRLQQERVLWPEAALTSLAPNSFAGLVVRGLLWEGPDGQLLRLRSQGWESAEGPAAVDGGTLVLARVPGGPSLQEGLLGWLPLRVRPSPAPGTKDGEAGGRTDAQRDRGPDPEKP